jgi:hypothetical protein
MLDTSVVEQYTVAETYAQQRDLLCHGSQKKLSTAGSSRRALFDEVS